MNAWRQSSIPPSAVDVPSCRVRQRRLLDFMAQRELDAVLLARREHVQWLTGAYFSPLFEPAALLTSDGRCYLAPPNDVAEACADEQIPYQAKWLSTLRNDQRQAACVALASAVRVAAFRGAGVEYSTATRHFPWDVACCMVDVEPTLLQFRRRKEQDELQRMAAATKATEHMYQHARGILRPGLDEMEMFNQLHSVAVSFLGQPPTGFGNDFRCAARGGPPRPQRAAQAGELYILDLGPAYQGYFADNARTLAVTEADSTQREAWSRVVEVFAIVEATVRPGTSARDLFERARQHLSTAPVGVFNHHLGHGVGLFPHEAPHLNPNWDDVFEVGDVFAVEPGLYDPRLRAGLRLENNYRVTENGVELLTDFALEM